MKRLLQLSLLLLSSSTLSAQWAIIHEDASEDYGAAHFLSADTGFVASSFNGIIYRTYDGGSSWSPHTTPIGSASYNKIRFTSTEIGYAVGANVTFLPRQMGLKTVDGGSTWDTLHFSDTTPYINFSRVEFTDNNNGIFVSNETYVTEDGAATFSLLPKPKDEDGRELVYSYFYDVAMLMPNYYVASCIWYESADAPAPDNDLMAIFTTTDGGNTWVERYRDTVVVFNITFANHNHGWATTANNVLHTTDAGVTWMKHPLPPLGTNGSIGNLLFTDEENGWMSVNQYPGPTQSGQLYKTNDGGATWMLDLSIPDRMITSFDILDEGTGYITTSGRIYKKSDTPSSIKQQHLDENRIKVYPNPAKDKVTIDHDAQTRVIAIELIDISGRVVKSFDPQANTLSIEHIASGSYLLQITTTEGIAVKKLAIE